MRIKVQKTGWTIDGMFMIALTFVMAASFLAGMKTLERVVNWEAHIETMVWNSYASALGGCVKMSKDLNSTDDHSSWDSCVKTATAISNDTREILTKEPIKMFDLQTSK